MVRESVELATALANALKDAEAEGEIRCEDWITDHVEALEDLGELGVPVSFQLAVLHEAAKIIYPEAFPEEGDVFFHIPRPIPNMVHSRKESMWENSLLQVAYDHKILDEALVRHHVSLFTHLMRAGASLSSNERSFYAALCADLGLDHLPGVPRLGG